MPGLNKFGTSRRTMTVVLITFSLLLVTSWHTKEINARAESQPPTCKVWYSEPPAGCPFQKSLVITGVCFTGKHARYVHADTWYPSWAANGHLYSPWTDGTVDGVRSSSAGPHATTGYATILGDNPVRLRIVNPGVYQGNPAPYDDSRFPIDSL
jgi:hypothetical protein